MLWYAFSVPAQYQNLKEKLAHRCVLSLGMNKCDMEDLHVRIEAHVQVCVKALCLALYVEVTGFVEQGLAM
jgi:hypothetical protein